MSGGMTIPTVRQTPSVVHLKETLLTGLVIFGLLLPLVPARAAPPPQAAPPAQARIQVRLTDLAGKPLDRVRASLHRSDTDCLTEFKTALTSSEGLFTFSGLRDGDYYYQLSYSKPDSDESWAYSQMFSIHKQKSISLEIQPAGRTIRGQATDKQGKPLAGVYLLARFSPEHQDPAGSRAAVVRGFMTHYQWTTTKTDANGDFVFDDLMAGLYTIQAGREGYESLKVNARSQGPEVKIVMSKSETP